MSNWISVENKLPFVKSFRELGLVNDVFICFKRMRTDGSLSKFDYYGTGSFDPIRQKFVLPDNMDSIPQILVSHWMHIPRIPK